MPAETTMPEIRSSRSSGSLDRRVVSPTEWPRAGARLADTALEAAQHGGVGQT